MSCNGCRVLRKGCSESCILRPCLQWIESAEAQGYATVFVAKFFGRAGLMSFISSVPESQQPALFQSLLFEACGRTVNPVNGAVGLLWTGNWHVCQVAVETVLRGGTLRPMREFLSSGGGSPSLTLDEVSEIGADMWRLGQDGSGNQFPSHDCRLSSSRSKSSSAAVMVKGKLSSRDQTLSGPPCMAVISNLPVTHPSLNAEESITTSCCDRGFGDQYRHKEDRKLLNLLL